MFSLENELDDADTTVDYASPGITPTALNYSSDLSPQ
jgi:hypothetical protein